MEGGLVHNRLKEIGRELLKSLGFGDAAIVEEYGVFINGKRYIVDLAAFAPRAEDPSSGRIIENYSIAVECGDVDPEKLEALKKRFNDTIHLSVEYVLESYWKILKYNIDSKLWEWEMKLNARVDALHVEIGKLYSKVEELDNKVGTKK